MEQLILTSIFYVWLFLMAFLLWRIDRNGNKQIEENRRSLLSVASKSAEAAHIAAQAALKLAAQEATIRIGKIHEEIQHVELPE